MSQHRFETKTSTGRDVEVTIGYDRPLHGFFLVVSAAELDTAAMADAIDSGDDESLFEEAVVYSNLHDIDLIDLGGFTLDLNYFKNKLALLGVALPMTIEHELQEDRRQRVGNRFCRYDSAGQALTDPEA